MLVTIISTVIEDHGTPLVEEPARVCRVRQLGIDETLVPRRQPLSRHPLRHPGWSTSAATR